MKTFKGTKDWSLGKKKKSYRYINGLGWEELCRVVIKVDGEIDLEGVENAKLIAAAPDLLEALQDVLLVFEERETAIPVSTQMKIEKAISKALN